MRAEARRCHRRTDLAVSGRPTGPDRHRRERATVLVLLLGLTAAPLAGQARAVSPACEAATELPPNVSLTTLRLEGGGLMDAAHAHAGLNPEIFAWWGLELVPPPSGSEVRVQASLFFGRDAEAPEAAAVTLVTDPLVDVMKEPVPADRVSAVLHLPGGTVRAGSAEMLPWSFYVLPMGEDRIWATPEILDVLHGRTEFQFSICDTGEENSCTIVRTYLRRMARLVQTLPDAVARRRELRRSGVCPGTDGPSPRASSGGVDRR